MKNKWLIGIFIVLILLVTGMYFGKDRLERWQAEKLRSEVPMAQDTVVGSQYPVSDQSENKNVSELPVNNDQSTISNSIPAELNLPVPFTPQAPTANWDAEHEEYCEEASALMVGRYFQGRGIDGPQDAESAMQELVQWENDHFGYFESTTATETAQMIREVYGLEIEVINIETVGDRLRQIEINESSDVSGQLSDVGKSFIKQSLADGKLIIIPAAGRKLGNPYFKQPGPLYHMLVIKGFTKQGDIITNDPGTKRGANYVYKWDKLYSAIGDWNNGNPSEGEKIILMISDRL